MEFVTAFIDGDGAEHVVHVNVGWPRRLWVRRIARKKLERWQREGRAAFKAPLKLKGDL